MTDGDVLGAVERGLIEYFAQIPARASVSFLGVEPIEVLRFEPVPGELTYVSLGMSRRPMTAATEFVLDGDGPRAELMLQARESTGRHPDVWRRVALLAAAPAVEGVVYVDGMTIDTGQPLAPGSRCTGGVIVIATPAAIPTADGDVAVLQVLPAASAELAWSRVHGTSALRERWSAAAVDLLDLGRRAVALD